MFVAAVPPHVYVPLPRVFKLYKNETNITVDCYGYGKPVPSVMWKRDGNPVKLVPYFTPNYEQEVVQDLFNTSSNSLWNITSRLYIRTGGVTYSEAGNYTCETSNAASHDSVTEEVEVLCKCPTRINIASLHTLSFPLPHSTQAALDLIRNEVFFSLVSFSLIL